ncbi:MAG: alkaline phosphatase family protein [Chlorobi bacterium]|nr:alkaline phosphatase family protein [Chlorobiota bacterium]
MKKIILLLLINWPVIFNGQEKLLNAGPMPGYSTMKEVAIWCQTTREATVFAKFWNVENPKEVRQTNTVNTKAGDGFTALLIAGDLEPGNTYQYELYINDNPVFLPYETVFHSQKIWKWRGDPPDFSFLTGSGSYINEPKYDRPGKPYGGGYEIYNSMAKKHPDFMIWLGDNVYLREPDWNSWSGIIHRYTHDRAIPELQEFLTSTHHYAIWDDHDYGPNDSDRGFWNKNMTMKAFELFWANPSYGVGDIRGAITSFQWGDADFFLLDNRTYRSPDRRKEKNKTELGEQQLQWLFDNLASSYATFKFVVMGGQFLSTSEKYESYSNYGFDGERKKIIDYIYKQNIHNVIFVTGDVHFSEISVLRKKGKPDIIDISSSPLNSGPNTNAINQSNALRVPGSVIMERNFAEVRITGPRLDRKVTVTYYDVNGKELYKYEFRAWYRERK